MRTPSPPYSRLDFAPPSADRFIFGVAPLDYGPVLLLKPFGFRLTTDTLPSGNYREVASGPPWLSPTFVFVPRLGAYSERWRSAFRGDGDRDSELMPIAIPR